MIFERSNGAFGSIDAMFFLRYPLELDAILGESIFQILGAFVVKNVEIGWMTLMDE